MESCQRSSPTAVVMCIFLNKSYLASREGSVADQSCLSGVFQGSVADSVFRWPLPTPDFLGQPDIGGGWGKGIFTPAKKACCFARKFEGSNKFPALRAAIINFFLRKHSTGSPLMYEQIFQDLRGALHFGGRALFLFYFF